MREIVDEAIYPDAQAREEDGKRPSQSVLDKMAYVTSRFRDFPLSSTFFVLQ
jgi:hypothetical protein